RPGLGPRAPGSHGRRAPGVEVARGPPSPRRGRGLRSSLRRRAGGPKPPQLERRCARIDGQLRAEDSKLTRWMTTVATAIALTTPGWATADELRQQSE